MGDLDLAACLRGGVSWLLELLAPSTCAACGEPSTRPFCFCCGEPAGAGAQSLSGLPLLAAGPYRSPLKEAIARFKYGGCPELAWPLATLVAPKLVELGVGPEDHFVPVPLHRRRLCDRGYDQAALLARALARQTGASCVPRLLERVRQTAQQAALDGAARTANVSGAFRVRQACRSGRVVLVDDVVTTGSTARACLEALAAAAVPALAVAALARAGAA